MFRKAKAAVSDHIAKQDSNKASNVQLNDKPHKRSHHPSSSSAKRPRAKEDKESTVSITYRASYIPEIYDIPTLQSSLATALNLPSPEEITIRSLCADFHRTPLGGKTRTATLEGVGLGRFLRKCEEKETGNGKVRRDRQKPKEWAVDIMYPGTQKVDIICLDANFLGFTPLSPDTESEYTVDCIAIHGLGSHAFGAYKASRDESFMWLRDRLPAEMPRLRIWTYGYALNLVDEDSFAGVDDHARTLGYLLSDMRENTLGPSGVPTPLIFIAHSLGGIVLKKAFVSMKGSSHQNILDATVGALFFGVPSHGMDITSLITMVGEKFQRYELALLDNRVGHHLKSKQHEEFCEAFPFRDAKIYQFFETKTTPSLVQDPITKEWKRSGREEILVPFSSATKGREWEKTDEFIRSIGSNHSEMVKFGRHDRVEYPKVTSALKGLVNNAVGVIDARRKALSKDEQACLQSLSFPDMEEIGGNIEKPVGTTFQWVWHDEDLGFEKFLENTGGGAFWIQGKPGSGKSTLMKHILEERRSQTDDEKELIVAFFFNNRGTPLEGTLEGFLRSLICQILRKYQPGFKDILRRYKKKTKDQSSQVEWDVPTLRTMLFELAEKFEESAKTRSQAQTILFIIDAIDECESTALDSLQDIISRLAAHPHTSETEVSSFKFCCSSRISPEIKTFAKQFPGLNLSDRNRNDIRVYVEQNTLEMTTTGDVQDKMFTAMLEEIIEKADGIFLWAKLVLKELIAKKKRGYSISELRDTLETIPPGLVELYTRMVNNIDSCEVHGAQVILRTVLCAYRPLSLKEIRVALTFGNQPFNTYEEYENCPAVRHDTEGFLARLLGWCGGLVEVVSEAGGDEKQASLPLSSAQPSNIGHEEDFIIQFIHQSAKDFVRESDFLDRNPLGRPQLSGNEFLFGSCVRLFALADIKSLSEKVNSDESWSVKYFGLLCADKNPEGKHHPFLEYATLFWIRHWCDAYTILPHNKAYLTELEKSFAPNLARWVPLFRAYSEEKPTHTSNTTLVSLAAENNLQLFFETAVACDVPLDTNTGRYGDVLQAATAKEHGSLVKYLLGKTVNIQASGGHYGNALVAAAATANLSLVLLLLQHGMPLTANTTKGESALRLALANNDPRIATVLLEHGAWKFESSSQTNKRHLLEIEAKAERWPAVELLLKHGADINEKFTLKQTLLHIAVDKDRGWVDSIVEKDKIANNIQRLLELGADVTARDSDDMTVLHKAAKYRYDNVVKIILQHIKNQPHLAQDRWSTLHLLITRGTKAMVDSALELDPNLDSCAEDGWTALHLAAHYENFEMMKFLLDNGADVNAVNADGWTALLLAAELANFQMTKLLIEKGADVSVKAGRGWTALHYGCVTNPRFCNGIEALLKAGADANALTDDATSALHIAVESHHSAMVRLLLSHGADVNKKTAESWTPLHFAIELLARRSPAPEPHPAPPKDYNSYDSGDDYSYNTKYASPRNYDSYGYGNNYTYNTNYGYNSRRRREAKSEMDVIAIMLLKNGASLNEQDRKGSTPLHLASRQSNTEAISILHPYTPDVNRKDHKSWTALHYAVQKAGKNDDIVCQLLRFNHDLEVQNEEGQTALHLSVQHGRTSLLKALLEAGAQTNTRDANGQTPLHLASSRCNTMQVKQLLNHAKDSCPPADPIAQDKDLLTPLHLAAGSGEKATDIITELLSHGAVIDAKCCKGSTPLLVAILNDSPKVAKLLIERGADKSVETNEGVCISRLMEEGKLSLKMRKVLGLEGQDENLHSSTEDGSQAGSGLENGLESDLESSFEGSYAESVQSEITDDMDIDSGASTVAESSAPNPVDAMDIDSDGYASDMTIKSAK